MYYIGEVVFSIKMSDEEFVQWLKVKGVMEKDILTIQGKNQALESNTRRSIVRVRNM